MHAVHGLGKNRVVTRQNCLHRGKITLTFSGVCFAKLILASSKALSHVYLLITLISAIYAQQ